jgi:nitrite reductase/ring-hydroxylating ferredoxin subunit/Fe-S cluster biogenesis protein NfuA
MGQSQVVASESPGLESYTRDISSLETIMASWDDGQRATVFAYRRAIEALHKEGFRRLIAGLKAEPAAMRTMRGAVADEVVYAVLRHLELVKPSLHERVEQALESVRPMLASHGGGVELVAVKPPETLEVRFLGSCDGCPASMLTFVAGVKSAIETACPEITNIVQLKGMLNGSGGFGAINFVSPFAINQTGRWSFAANLDDVPEGGLAPLSIAGRSVILSRNGAVVACFENACAHLGMPIDMGEVADGIVTCPHHGFQYDLRSGECLTAPEVALQSHAVRVVGRRVEVRLSS